MSWGGRTTEAGSQSATAASRPPLRLGAARTRMRSEPLRWAEGVPRLPPNGASRAGPEIGKITLCALPDQNAFLRPLMPAASEEAVRAR